ncbi:hypothetical protein [Acidovorax sp.]|uniref:hypothetical protein n=1 Tax=Acidovorax sp. TaxID=1872122 RepID=UPI003D08049C
MDKDKYLADHTFSEAGFDTWRRVADTLTQDPALEPKRTAKLIGLLLQRLEQKELLDISEIDDMLVEII